MSFEKTKAILELTRPFNCLITALSIAAAAILAGAGREEWVRIVSAAVVGAFVAAGANAVNDYFDVEIDRVNRPRRPIPRGAISREQARAAWFVFSMIALGLSLTFTPTAVGIVLFAVVALYVYSLSLKKTLLIGNIVVALMTALAFIYGAVVVDKLERAFMPALFAFLINLARELVKDVEDIQGDREMGATTLPIKYGTKSSVLLTTAVLAILIAATLAAYAMKFYSIVYLYVVLFVDLLLLYGIVSLWKDLSPASLRRVSLMLKLNMVLGLFAIFFGSL